MTDNITHFTGSTTLDLDPDKIIEAAIGEMQEVVIIGYDLEGELYFACSSGNKKNTLWLLKEAEKELLSDE